jgi:hypothetical protein
MFAGLAREYGEKGETLFPHGKWLSAHVYTANRYNQYILYKVGWTQYSIFRIVKKQKRAQSRQSAKLFLQSSELGLPQPITRRRVCPLPSVLGGGAHSLAREVVGESQFRRGDIHCGTLYIYVLCGKE